MDELSDNQVHYLMLGVLKECYQAGMDSITRGDLYAILGVEVGADEDPNEMFEIDARILEVDDDIIHAGIDNRVH